MTRRTLLFSGLSALAIRQGKIDEAVKLIQGKIDSGEVKAAALHVRQGGDVIDKTFGTAKTPRASFLLASISKPMTVTGIMVLVDRKELRLDDPIQKYLPDFKGGERDKAIVRHLVTHTSGLPDMLPENVDLRKRHAPLKDFIALGNTTPLRFTPGTRVAYQSTGILLAAAILERITKKSLNDFLQDNVYKPLGMSDTTMGLAGRKIADTVPNQLDQPTDFDWNSEYWRNLGAPWGGAIGSASDVGKFIRYFAHPDGKVVKPETAAMMIANQTGLEQKWGLGWTLSGANFAKGCSERTYGHGGDTGTSSWHDPERDLTCVILNSLPARLSSKILLKPASDLVSESV